MIHLDSSKSTIDPNPVKSGDSVTITFNGKADSDINFTKAHIKVAGSTKFDTDVPQPSGSKFSAGDDGFSYPYNW